MATWLAPALDYLERWLEFQMRQSELPGCTIAVAHRGRLVLERAYGYGERALITRDARGRAKSLWVGGRELRSERDIAREMDKRYGRR
jgi:D-alanyl-D-alanine carboxypeptidase